MNYMKSNKMDEGQEAESLKAVPSGSSNDAEASCKICFMRTWEITQILQFTVLTNVDVNGSQIVKVYCYWTMKCLNVLSLWKMYFHLPCQRNV